MGKCSLYAIDWRNRLAQSVSVSGRRRIVGAVTGGSLPQTIPLRIVVTPAQIVLSRQDSIGGVRDAHPPIAQCAVRTSGSA